MNALIYVLLTALSFLLKPKIERATASPKSWKQLAALAFWAMLSANMCIVLPCRDLSFRSFEEFWKRGLPPNQSKLSIYRLDFPNSKPSSYWVLKMAKSQGVTMVLSILSHGFYYLDLIFDDFDGGYPWFFPTLWMIHDDLDLGKPPMT